MVNEWVKVELYGNNNDGDPRRYTIADGASVSKGTLLELTDPRTAVACTGSQVPIAGVAAEEHVAGQGVTTISAWTNGIFEAVCSGAIILGQNVCGGTAGNAIASAAVIYASGASVLGYALETGSANETINVRLRL